MLATVLAAYVINTKEFDLKSIYLARHNSFFLIVEQCLATMRVCVSLMVVYQIIINQT